MKRILLIGFSLGIMTAISAVAFQQPNQAFPLLDWAKEADPGKATTALVLEFEVRARTDNSGEARAELYSDEPS